MNLISISFLLFIILTLLFYYVIPHKHRWIVLLVSSVFFYAFGGWEKIFFVLAAGLVAYLAARHIGKLYDASSAGLVKRSTPKKRKQARKRERKERLAEEVAKKRARRTLVIGIILILLMLVYAKTGQEIFDAIRERFSFEGGIEKLIIPLGISYYSLSLIGYLADVYWKKDQPEKNFFKLLLYMIYFPHILEGPIPRHNRLAPQLIEGHPFVYKDFCFGLQRMLWGYFKKMVIADRISIVTTQIFGSYESYEGFYFVIAVLASAVQLYTDFSGCMDIVLGISECLGIHLDENFARPFFAKTAAEYWRRWHITLGTWFKDYVYMPLVVNPKLTALSRKMRDRFGMRAGKNLMTIVPLAVVWLLTGLWHGTRLDYLLWGCYWGLIIILTTVFAPEIRKLNEKLHINTKSGLWQGWQMIRTFLIFCGARLLTAPGDIKVTAYMITHFKWNPWIFFDDSLFSLGLDWKNVVLLLLCILLLWHVERKQEHGVSFREKTAALPLVLRWILYYGLFFSIIIFGIYGPGYNSADFVYMQF